MWQEEGFKGFMRGNGINCLRIVPYSAVQFTTYEQLKKVRVLAVVIEILYLIGCSCLRHMARDNLIPRRVCWPELSLA